MRIGSVGWAVVGRRGFKEASRLGFGGFLLVGGEGYYDLFWSRLLF